MNKGKLYGFFTYFRAVSVYGIEVSHGHERKYCCLSGYEDMYDGNFICSWLIETSSNTTVICGNKMPTRCNRGFYCWSYCLLNMFRAPLCPSSGTQEYYTVVAACGISCCGFQVADLVWNWGLCVRFAGCCSILQTGHITLSHFKKNMSVDPAMD